LRITWRRSSVSQRDFCESADDAAHEIGGFLGDVCGAHQDELAIRDLDEANFIGIIARRLRGNF